MGLLKPYPGLVICYEFLWGYEQRAGQTQGEKRRPCVVVTAVRDHMGEALVTVAPVTHSEPTNPAYGVEIPRRVKDYLGLDSARSWIISTDLNEFIWPGDYLFPIPGGRMDQYDYGTIPPALFAQLKAQILALAEDVQMVQREPA